MFADEPIEELAKVFQLDDPFVDTMDLADGTKCQILKSPRDKLQLKLPVKVQWDLKAELQGSETVFLLAQKESWLGSMDYCSRIVLVNVSRACWALCPCKCFRSRQLVLRTFG